MNYILLEDLYKTICQNHIKLLYDIYNSEINTYNKIPFNRKTTLMFIADNTVNAFAKVTQCDEVTIHIGMLKKVHECTQKMMEYDDTFTDYRERQIVSVFMFSTIMHYILAHEFAHLYSGHCDFLNSFNSQSTPLQFGYSSGMGISSLDFQTLEMNADAIAMCRTIDYVIFEPHHGKEVTELLHNNYYLDLFFLKAINIMFFVLRGFLPPIYNENYRNSSHHPNFLRQIMNYQTIKKYFDMEYGRKLPDGLLDECFASDEKKLCDLYFIPPTLEHYMRNLDTDILYHQNSLRVNWAKIRSKIDPYSRMEIPFI